MKNRGATRRTFLGSAGAAALLADANLAADTDRPPDLPIIGEPYALLGKRLGFLNWHYIRTGNFVWMDPSGKKVGLTDRVAPGAAHFRPVDQPSGIRLMAQPARRMGPLFQAEKPWEEGSVAITTVLKDAGMFRGWCGPFTTSGNPSGQKHYVYFESTDGIHWKRPNLGIVEENGSRANNIVNIFGTDGGSIFIDPSAPAAERYKLIAEGPFSKDICDAYQRKRPKDWDPRTFRRPNGSATGVKAAVSADGLHWEMFRDPLVMEVTDTQLTAYYDQQLQKYVAYTRTWVTGLRSGQAEGPASKAWQVGRRSIGRSETTDFHALPLAKTILEPSPDSLPTDLLYTNAKTTFPGAPDHHLLFPAIWHIAKDNTSIGIASSHDGSLWHFLPGSPILETGTFGEFDGGVVFAHPNLVELGNGDFVLPYTGYNVPHKYPRGLWKYAPGYAVWPQGRIVALEAPEQGEFSTVGIVPPGRSVRINANTQRAGSILVEVAGMDGKPLKGRSFAEANAIVGDHPRTLLSWKEGTDLGHPENSGIVLRFRMNYARLFYLEFE